MTGKEAAEEQTAVRTFGCHPTKNEVGLGSNIDDEYMVLSQCLLRKMRTQKELYRMLRCRTAPQLMASRPYMRDAIEHFRANAEEKKSVH